jgi:hypothetical protein
MSFFGDPAFFGPFKMLSFTLDDEDLSLASAGTNIPPLHAAPPGASCPSLNDWNSLAWVADMSALRAGTMSRNHFTGRNPALALARFDIPAGIDLATWGFARDAMMNVARFQFTDGSTSIGSLQALANIVAIAMSMTSPGGEVVLTSSNASAGSVVLKPASGRVTAWLANIPPPELTMSGPPMAPGTVNDHFHVFYGMSTAMNPTMFLPELIDGICGPLAFGSASSPKCPPALFAAHA